jgi:hypothetical protein
VDMSVTGTEKVTKSKPSLDFIAPLEKNEAAQMGLWGLPKGTFRAFLLC